MVKNHLKRIACPRTWPIRRKQNTFIKRPDVGRKLSESLALSVVLRDLMGIADTTKEVKKIITDKSVLVDGKSRKTVSYPIGLFDVIEIPSTNESFRLVLTIKGKLALVKVPKQEVHQKICKIIGKKMLPKGKLQLNLFDGKNLLIDNKDYKVGGSVLLKVPEMKIVDYYAFEIGASVFMVGGSHIGELGTIKEIDQGQMIVQSGSSEFESPIWRAVIVGKEKPIITIREEKK